ncbi:poly-beta-1,6 N-acetyl-D-glucosamine export porin PgaA, partial [Methylicorpusculum sp.]|uniref:poly-beta-1,6 N-acetyl-D-glucosamine export porin PgaA n=1 Tax=Methylicorpusculum sp. TaxID=2713644 RepID=UPI002ABBA6C6
MKPYLFLAVFCLPSAIAFGQTHDEEQRYQDALAAARAGNTQWALGQLDQLKTQHPKILRYLYDYIQILSWTDQSEAVIKQSQNLDLKQTPVYVIEAVAKAARNTGDFIQSESLYRLALEKSPARFEPKLGIGLVFLDSGNYDRAIAYFNELTEAYPQQIEPLLSLAYAYEYRRDFASAIKQYQKVIAQQADHSGAWIGLVFALKSSGQYEEALSIAKQHRLVFSDEEWAEINWDYAAFLIRKSERIATGDPSRYPEMDKAIDAVNANLVSVDTLNLNDPQNWRNRATFDLMLALRNRKKMQAVIKLYEEMYAQGIEIPAYCRIAAADAYLYQQQPEVARDLYLSVIAESPQDFNARSSLVYAYLESEQINKAIHLADQLDAEQPDTIQSQDAQGQLQSTLNPAKTATELTAAIMRAYADRLEEGQFRMESLRQKSPYNPDIESKLAEIYYYRGWPRKARQQIENALIESPDHLGLQIGQAKVNHDLRAYPAEERQTHKLYKDFSDDTGVQRQMRLWRIHNDRELKVFTGGGLSNNELDGIGNPNLGTEDISVDSYLYSSPINYNYRAFIHQGWKMGLFPQPEGRGYLQTYGLGMEYAANNVLANAEVHYDNFAREAIGVGLGLAYDIDDHWRVSTYLDSNNNQISLRALTALADEKRATRAKSAQFRLTHRVHESRQFDFTFNYLNFSDNNNRYGIDGAYYERWISGPIYKFATYLNAGYSTNTRNSGSPDNPNLKFNGYYFNPAQDASVSVTLDNDFLTYRYYDTAFNQRVAVSIGNYWQ